MPEVWAEGVPSPTDPLLSLRRQERSQRACYWRLLVSDDRFSRRRRLPRLASPVSTFEVETSHPLVLCNAVILAHPAGAAHHSAAGRAGVAVAGLGAHLIAEGGRGSGGQRAAGEDDRVAVSGA